MPDVTHRSPSSVTTSSRLRCGLEVTLPTGPAPDPPRDEQLDRALLEPVQAVQRGGCPTRDGRLVTEVVEAGEERSPPIELAAGEVQGVGTADDEGAGP